MSLNIAQDRTSADPAATGSESPRRGQLVDELTAELTAWSPREFLFAFRRMHHGSLSLIHLNVMALLEAEGPMAMGHLAEALDVSVASVTGIVTRMEARGLVERVHAAHDRRVVLVGRTQAGMDVFRGMDEHRRAGLRRILGQLSDDELAGFLAGHRALRAARAAYMREEGDAMGNPGPAGYDAGRATADASTDHEELTTR